MGKPFESGEFPDSALKERWDWDYRSQRYILVPGWNKHCACGLVHAEDSPCCRRADDA